MKRKCSGCGEEFEESEMEESHNVPIYLFQGQTRPERKNQADRLGRTLLCKECHDKYEAKVLQLLFLNLLSKEVPLILDREERKPYFPKIWRLPEGRKKIGIKICLRVKEDIL